MKKYLLFAIALPVIFIFSVFVYFGGDTKSEDISVSQSEDEPDLELYKENKSRMVGEPSIRDIDGDGFIEKVVRYDVRMADRFIQELYIYREINGEYKIIKTFSGDPYGFAKLVEENTILVGRFLPIQEDISKKWDDDNFEQFEMTRYKWTKEGEVEIDKSSMNAKSRKELSEEIRNNFYGDFTNATYKQVIDSKSETPVSMDMYDTQFDGDIIEWKAKISAHYSQITGVKFCVVDEDHKNVDIDESCDWFWAFSGETMGADDIKVNPDWDGHWVDYILNYYKVPFNKKERFYDSIYTVKGVVGGLDCGVYEKCVPNIEILSITR